MSLEILNLNRGGEFTGGLPAEWGSMTNLKELTMTYCGLDGECLVYAQVNTTSLRCKSRARRTAAQGDASVARDPQTEQQRREWRKQVHGRHPGGVELDDEPQNVEDGLLRP